VKGREFISGVDCTSDGCISQRRPRKSRLVDLLLQTNPLHVIKFVHSPLWDFVQLDTEIGFLNSNPASNYIHYYFSLLDGSKLDL